jgi:hypothetical protein
VAHQDIQRFDEAVDCLRLAGDALTIEPGREVHPRLAFDPDQVIDLYSITGARSGGIKAIESANFARYGSSKNYRTIRKVDDLMYLKESQFIQLGEDAGMYNRTARKLLDERLDLRNRCGHPTGYKPGRGEVVIFIESLAQNILSGSMLNW